MMPHAQSLALLLLATALPVVTAQELVVVVESAAFTLDTRFPVGSGIPTLVVTVESPVLRLDTRLSPGNDASALVATAISPVFTLDTRLSSGPNLPALVVAAESPSFTLDTRLAGSRPVLATLVVMAESGAFSLDARLEVPRAELIVEAVSPAFELNTMWVRIRKLALALNSPLELYWTTNAPGFHPQVTDPPLSPSSIWHDIKEPVTESGGLFHIPVTPAGTNRFFRLSL